MQWIQYQLDNAATIDDVEESAHFLQIHPTAPTAIHCFVADKNGNSLIFESIGGTLHHYRPDDKNLPVLTNDPYDKSIRLMNKCVVFGGDLKVPDGQGSISRFIRIATAFKNTVNNKSDPIMESFGLLRMVSIPFFTKWTIVYNINNLEINFKTHSKKGLKMIKLNSCDFNCSEPVQYIDLVNNFKGDISKRFKEFNNFENQTFVKGSFKDTPFLKYINKDYIQ